MTASEFTPTTEQVRDGFAYDAQDEYINPLNSGSNAHYARRGFDRWLAEHDAGVRKATLAGTIAIAEKHVMYAEHCAGCGMASVIASELRSVTEPTQ